MTRARTSGYHRCYHVPRIRTIDARPCIHTPRQSNEALGLCDILTTLHIQVCSWIESDVMR